MMRSALSLLVLVALSGCASSLCTPDTPCKAMPLRIPDASMVSRVEVIEYPTDQRLLTQGVGPCAVTVTDPVVIADVLSELRGLPDDWYDVGTMNSPAYPKQLNVVGASSTLLAFQYKDGAARAVTRTPGRVYFRNDPSLADGLREIHERFIPQCLFPAR